MTTHPMCQLTHHYDATHQHLTLRYMGNGNLYTLSFPWTKSLQLVKRYQPTHLEIDLDQLDSYDSAFVHLLAQLKTHQIGKHFQFKSENYPIRTLFDAYEHQSETMVKTKPKRIALTIWEKIGYIVFLFPNLLRRFFEFFGQLMLKIPTINPYFPFLLDQLYQTGAMGILITALMGVTLGIILTFQGAIALSIFGAKSYSANMTIIAMTREIGPLMTALVVSGRSVAAFASEIGAMNINQEIDALQTMAIDKMRLLIIPRVWAVILTIPLLNLYMIFFSLIGCTVIFLNFGYSVRFFMEQLYTSLTLTNLLGGLIKATVFGAIIATVGCVQGLKAKKSSLDVGKATTSAVVLSIILITIVDGLFAVIFYQIGI